MIWRFFLERILNLFYFLLYGSLAGTYDVVSWLVSGGRWSSWVNILQDDLESGPILELGHGPGHLLVQLISSFKVGLDRSAQMGHIARQRNPGIPIVRADGRHIPFSNQYFNQVVATFPTDYIFEAETLSGIRRVLLPKGELLLVLIVWIQGKSWGDEVLKLLFRLTGQTPPEEFDFTPILRRLENRGFEAKAEFRQLVDSKILVIRARKPE
jgi:ubiquinone/menaquinone biosynthesis C-methylase UbiE